MTLKEWLKRKGMSQREFARRIGSDQGNVSDWVRRKALPRVLSIQRIARATRGAVQFSDWVRR